MIEVNGTFDIETSEWDKFALGCTHEGLYQTKIWYNGREMIDYMRAKGGTWWGHCAGTFDTIWVARDLTERGIAYQASESDHRITRLVCGSLQLRDSYALWPGPLDGICAALGVEAPSLPWPCICGHACGGYCQIGPRASEGDPDLEDYCRQDCITLFDGLHLLIKVARERGITLAGTMGMSAWRTAQGRLGLPDADLPWRTWRHIRHADKGGRQAIVRVGHPGPGVHWDMINAYPSALEACALPVGECRELGARDALRALHLSRPGIYTAEVTVPEAMFFPPLPWRIGGRITYPTGTFAGSWALPELCAAIERGVIVERVASAIIWEAEAPIFGGLMREWYNHRRELGTKSPLGQWFSRLSKSLTGKFAEDPMHTRILAYPDEVKLCPRTGRCWPQCSRRCLRYDQIDLFGAIWSAPYWHMAESAHVHWSVYLRAVTRVTWMAQAERFGKNVCYGNTDSLWVIGRKKPSPVGGGLGDWERKNDWTDWQCRGPNVYRYQDPQNGAQHRAAGTHAALTDIDWKRGNGVLERGVESFRQGARNPLGLFKRRHRRWTIPQHPDDGWYGDRRLAATEGVTYPADAKEHRQRGQRANTKADRP